MTFSDRFFKFCLDEKDRPRYNLVTSENRIHDLNDSAYIHRVWMITTSIMISLVFAIFTFIAAFVDRDMILFPLVPSIMFFGAYLLFLDESRKIDLKGLQEVSE